MKAMAYKVTNGISIHKNKSVVQGKELRYNPPSFALFPFIIIGQSCSRECSIITSATFWDIGDVFKEIRIIFSKKFTSLLTILSKRALTNL